MQRRIDERDMRKHGQKSKNRLLTPHYLPKGVYRRAATRNVLPANKLLGQLYELVAKSDTTVLEFDPYDAVRIATQWKRFRGNPHQREGEIKIPGAHKRRPRGVG